jgi:hypothetical protein
LRLIIFLKDQKLCYNFGISTFYTINIAFSR